MGPYSGGRERSRLVALCWVLVLHVLHDRVGRESDNNQYRHNDEPVEGITGDAPVDGRPHGLGALHIVGRAHAPMERLCDQH